MQTPSSPLRAIIVEDETTLLMLLEDMLAELGVSVVGTASDVHSALALVRDSSYDFAILDAHIVGGDIDPVFDLLRQRDIPIMFSTGDSPQSIREKFGGVAVLAKPYIAKDLEVALQQICYRSQL